MPTTNTFELNGKRYDAITGRLLGEASTSTPPSSHTADSFMRSQPHRDQVAAPVIRQVAPLPLHIGTAFDIRRSPGLHAKAHQPEHSKTLMRRAVKKPDMSFKRHVKAVAPTDVMAKQPMHPAMVAPKPAMNQPNNARLERAQQISKSQMINRYGAAAQTQRPAAMAVQPAPYTQASAPRPYQPTVALRQASPQQSTTNASKASSDIFERALATATSHTQNYPSTKKKAKRASRVRQGLSIVSSAIAIMLIIGFVAYSNAASIQLRIASSQSGINATLPKWHPEGYKLGKFTYGPGSVTISFNSSNTSDSYSIAQAPTNWDSSTLLNDYVYPNNNTYDTIQTNGNTIYTYGNNNATWVSGGIWYKLSSNGALSTTDIVHIAASM